MGDKKRIRLVVTGCCGRMGSLIARTAEQVLSDDFQLVEAVEREGYPQIGQALSGDIPLKITDNLNDALPSADLLVEFTTPEASVAHALAAASAKVPIVIGTTGFSAEQFDQLHLLSKNTPIFWSPNMSLGIFILRKDLLLTIDLLKKFGYESGDIKIKISETHHTQKKDRPSGTAKQLAEDMAQSYGSPAQWIPIESKREGEVVGIHTVSFNLGHEVIEFRHEVTDRAVFAVGALFAARRFFQSFKDRPGWYGMDDLWSPLK